LAQAAHDLKVPVRRIGEDAMRALMRYSFPGNVRELKNLIERACILSLEGDISAEHFPMAAAGNVAPVRSAISACGELSPEQIASALPETLDLRGLLSGLEKALLKRALDNAHGAQVEAARKLGLSRSDISYKLSKHGMRNSHE
jgi:DNA-binding NtrC family response regulator